MRIISTSMLRKNGKYKRVLSSVIAIGGVILLLIAKTRIDNWYTRLLLLFLVILEMYVTMQLSMCSRNMRYIATVHFMSMLLLIMFYMIFIKILFALKKQVVLCDYFLLGISAFSFVFINESIDMKRKNKNFIATYWILVAMIVGVLPVLASVFF